MEDRDFPHMRIASLPLRPHHYGMETPHRLKQSATNADCSALDSESGEPKVLADDSHVNRLGARGNVAIAALLLVVGIGAAAVALDSARVYSIAQSSQAQLAQAVTAPGTSGTADKSSDGEVKGKCDIGFDYEVREEQKGQPTVKPRGATQCPKIDSKTPYKDPEGKTRYCTKDGWKCRYFYCKIDSLRVKNAQGKPSDAECVLMGSAGKPGEAADLSSGRTTALKDAIDKKLLDPSLTKDDVKAMAPYVQSLDKNVQASLLNAFDTDQQQQKLVDLQKEYAQAKDNLISCLAMAVPGACDDQAKTEADAKQKLDDQKQRLEQLAKNAEPLGDVKKVLTAGTNPDASKVYNCPGGPDCKGGEWKDGKLVGGTDCSQAVNQGKPDCSTFQKPPPGGCTGGNCGGGGGDTKTNSTGGSGNIGDFLKGLAPLMPLLGQLLNNALQPTPSCTVTASPKNITQPGAPVTLSWTSQNAQSAYLSASGQVGPTGSITVNPQQTTTYTLQVVGYPPQTAQQQQQQQYNPYGQQQQDQYCVTSTFPVVWQPYPAVPGCLNYRATSGYGVAPPVNPGQIQPQAGGTPQQGQCTTQVTVGAQTPTSGTDTGTSSDKPKAQISCQPKIADVGMTVSISYACQNASTSKGDNFSTDNQQSGSATADVTSPTAGSTNITYGLTCSKDGQTDSAQCTVNVNKPSIVLVGNPKNVKSGAVSNIGWVTGAMESCVISSPTLGSDWKPGGALDASGNPQTSGAVKSPALTQSTKFVLNCTTKAGGTKTAETTVEIQ